MATQTRSSDHIGGIVRVRQRQNLIDEVYQCALTSRSIVKLSCVDPDHLGRSLEVIWQEEFDTELLETEQWGVPGGRGFDPPDRFSAYYYTLRWKRVTASRTDLLQVPFRAGIKIEHHQLELLRMALSMLRAHLFVADGGSLPCG